MRFSTLRTELGHFGFVGTSARLLSTYLPRGKRDLLRCIQRDWPEAVETADLLPRFRRELNDYFAGRTVRFTVSIDLSKQPPFFRAVYEACRKVPYGKTASYLDLARAAGSPNAARAVGQAMARNPMPLVIPCHRIVSADGSLGGFSSPRGLQLKSRLLRLERGGGRMRDVA
jgi:methylated-DNA-[protein]-cysteine S-methyltransferase